MLNSIDARNGRSVDVDVQVDNSGGEVGRPYNDGAHKPGVCGAGSSSAQRGDGVTLKKGCHLS